MDLWNVFTYTVYNGILVAGWLFIGVAIYRVVARIDRWGRVNGY